MNTLRQGDRFEDMGFQLARSDVELGETYPFFGMITKILEEVPGRVKVEINFHMTAEIQTRDEVAINTLKERLFESGVFVATVTAKDPRLEIACQTVIFGRRQGMNA